jgi:hypothetical protein
MCFALLTVSEDLGEIEFECIGKLPKLVRLLKPISHSSQKLTRKLAARTFIQSQYMKAIAASLQVGVCDEWKRGFSVIGILGKRALNQATHLNPTSPSNLPMTILFRYRRCGYLVRGHA